LPLTPGTRLGVYEIVAPIGEGGMGQVYRATDSTLGRQVAIKILPDAFASDPERMARFEREAKTLASLNHPHIAAIYAVEKSGGLHALVMELVEGEDVSQRIAKGAIPLDEALPIAKQIAEALEAAHEQGIIHRDLKPANIKVRADGTVKVLDFGLAKAMEPAAGSSPNMSMSPTITTPAMTQSGMILGTAAYMSPEQASGRPVDKRADIWSFGVVFFEMLSGQRLFGGETIAHTLADVLRAPIDVGKLPKETPRVIRTVVARCLDRDVKTRLRDIGEARVTIGKYLADPANGEVTHRARPARQWVTWAVAAVLATLAIVGWLRPRPEGSSPTADLALTIAPTTGGLAPVGDLQATPEISPDGTAVMFYGDGEHLRRLN
jgi:eukaryotic-like serine/threonine-protein kinase